MNSYSKNPNQSGHHQLKGYYSNDLPTWSFPNTLLLGHSVSHRYRPIWPVTSQCWSIWAYGHSWILTHLGILLILIQTYMTKQSLLHHTVIPEYTNDTLGHTIIPKHYHTRSYSYSQTLTHLAKVLQNTNSLLYHTSQMLPHFHTRPKHTWSYCYHHILTNSFFVVVDDIFSDIIVNVHHIRVFLLSSLAGVDDENQNQNYSKDLRKRQHSWTSLQLQLSES